MMGSSVAVAAESPKDIAEKIESFYAEKEDIRATFTQEVRKPGRRRVIRKTGKVFFKRPGMMRWDYRKPEAVHYISDGSVLWSYQPEDSLVTRLNVQHSELYHQSRYLFGQGQLSNDFTLSLRSSKDTTDAGLLMTPKRKSRHFKSLTLWVNPQTGEIRSTELVDPYDNVSRVIFEKLQYKVLDRSVFEFSPPQGVQIRDLSKAKRSGS
jgi:outer membrane lipoprotein carrier protein